MNDEDWDSGFGKSVAVYLNGHGIPDLDPRGQRVTDDSFVICFNAHHEPIEFTAPPEEFGAAWQPVIDTAADAGAPDADPVAATQTLKVGARAIVVLQAVAQQ
jgi:glycogen operon protein